MEDEVEVAKEKKETPWKDVVEMVTESVKERSMKIFRKRGGQEMYRSELKGDEGTTWEESE